MYFEVVPFLYQFCTNRKGIYGNFGTDMEKSDIVKWRI